MKPPFSTVPKPTKFMHQVLPKSGETGFVVPHVARAKHKRVLPTKASLLSAPTDDVSSPSSEAWSDTFKDLHLDDSPQVDPLLELSDHETPSSNQGEVPSQSSSSSYAPSEHMEFAIATRPPNTRRRAARKNATKREGKAQVSPPASSVSKSKKKPSARKTCLPVCLSPPGYQHESSSASASSAETSATTSDVANPSKWSSPNAFSALQDGSDSDHGDQDFHKAKSS